MEKQISAFYLVDILEKQERSFCIVGGMEYLLTFYIISIKKMYQLVNSIR